MSALRYPDRLTGKELWEHVSRLPLKVRAPLVRMFESLYYQQCDTFLYAIQAGEDGPIKIGKADEPWQRIATLQQGNPAQLIGLAAWRAMAEEEKHVHKQFAHARIRGEWFHPTPELVEFVLAMGGEFCDWEKPGPNDWEALEG